MKKKLIMLSLALISCVCVAVGFSACSDKNDDDDSDVVPTTEHTHTLTAVAATDATCEKAGNSAYWYCADCGKYYSDANATTEISQTSTVIAALGHDYDDAVFSWDYTNGTATATATRTCLRDDSHTDTAVSCTVNMDSETAAKCLEDGSVTYTATATFSDGSTETQTKTYTLAATGHTYYSTWKYDTTYHWHEASCGHDVVSGYASHSFSYNTTTQKYECECGYVLEGNVVAEYTTALGLGDNYLYFTDQTSTLGVDTYASQTLKYTVTTDGEYTFSVPEDSKFILYVNDTDKNYTLGDPEGDGYSISFVASVGNIITIYWIELADSTDTFSNYILDLYISYSAVTIGTEDTPYAFSSVSDTAETTTVDLAGNASYYFSVPSTSNMGQLSFSSSVELYLVGEESDTQLTLTESNGVYYYYFNSYTPATYYVKATSATENLTISCATWTPTLTTGTNTLTISSSFLSTASTGKYFRYYLSVTGGYIYSFAFGSESNNKDNVELKSSTYSTASTYLSTSESNNYAATSTARISLYIFYSGEEDSFTVTIEITAAEEDIASKTAAVTVNETEITNDNVGSPVTCSVMTYEYLTTTSYETVIIKYTPSTTGTYVLTFGGNSAWTSYVANYSGNISLTYDDTTVKGARGVYVLSLTEGTAYILTLKLNGTTTAYNLTATLATGYTDVLAVSDSAQSVVGGKVYIFTATADGDYTFTVTSSSNEYSYSSDVYVSDGTSAVELYYGGYGSGSNGLAITKTLSEGDVIYIYCYDSTKTCSITITSGSTGSEDGEGDGGSTDYTTNVPETLIVGDNTIILSASDAGGDGKSSTFTAEVAGTYVFAISNDGDGYVQVISQVNTLQAGGTLYVELELTAGRPITIKFWSKSYGAATYTLSINLKNDEEEEEGETSSTLTIGQTYTVTLSEDNSSVNETITIETAGYYKITASGATVVISDSAQNYYYNTSNCNLGYIIDNSQSDEVAIIVPAGTVLYG